MEKILTIAIPTYNMEKLLPRCLDSLIQPKISEKLEVLVINDGSKDKSLEIAEEYSRRYPNIIFAVDKKNGNYGSAINKAIDLAKGKYFRILDSDDYYNNTDLNVLINHLEGINVDLVLTNYRRDQGNIKRYFKAPEEGSGKILDFNNVNISDYPNFAMHGITYKTSILQNNGIRLTEGISYTDSEYCFYPLQFVNTMVSYDLCVYCYQIGRPGQTVEVNSLIKCIPHMERIIRRMYSKLQEMDYSSAVYENQLNMFCNVVNLCFLTALCYDKSDQYLNTLGDLKELIVTLPNANQKMLTSNMYGIKFYKRYVVNNKTSHGCLFTYYYRSVRFVYYFIKSTVATLSF